MNAIEKYRGIIYKGVELKQLKSGLCNKIKSKKKCDQNFRDPRATTLTLLAESC